MQFDVRGRMTKYRWLIAGSHYATWKLAEWFPEAIPLTYVLGFPKSGTTWVSQLMADLLQLPFPRLSILPIGCPAVVHGHEVVSPPRQRSVYVIRDGRDVMVSLYFHMAQRIPEGDCPKLNADQRRQFPGLRNKANVVENLPAFIEYQMSHPKSSFGLNWGQHVERYFDLNRTDVPLLRYEELLTAPFPCLSKAVHILTGRELPDSQVQATIDKFSFQSQSRRSTGQEDRGSFLRNGQAGDWKRYFNKASADIFDHHCKAALAAAGYEATSQNEFARAA